MIYSRWRPDQGGYDYFDDRRPHNINDDLPTPELASAKRIGVPSIEAGRPIPSGAVYVGSGPAAVGSIAPVDEGRIVRRTRSLAGDAAPPEERSGVRWILAGLALGAASLLIFRR